MKLDIPKEVQKIGEVLASDQYKAYLVGGCTRDLLLKKIPKDWDIATDAVPKKIQELFLGSVYENEFGTVGVKTDATDPTLKIVEVTTFRKEGRYTDKRHPDEITFAKTIEEDLARRDFTVNALAILLVANSASSIGKKRKTDDPQPATRNTQSAIGDVPLVDPYNGQADLKQKIIRAVGDPNERFNEDALRLLRAVRFAAQLGFTIEEKTAEAIKKNASLLEMVSKERIRDEFSKLIMTDDAANGIRMLQDLGLLRYIVPELVEGVGVTQNLHHIYTVFEHNVRALEYTVTKKYSFEVRLSALLHDVGKPRTKHGEGKYSTFYNHEVVGGKMTLKILDRLRFSREIIEYVAHLVRCHLFYYNVGEVSEAGVRRFIARLGIESIDDILRVREADRIGSGVPKAFPYKLRHLKFMIEKVRRDPVSPKMLAVKGEDVMEGLSIPASPRVGHILAALLEEVLDDPQRNTRELLIARMQELNKLSDAELIALRKKSEQKKEEFEAGVEKEMKKRYAVE